MTKYDSRPKCNKCKESKTGHASGVCSGCRYRTCADCKRVFTPRSERKLRCHACEHNLRELINTHANYFNSGGV